MKELINDHETVENNNNTCFKLSSVLPAFSDTIKVYSQNILFNCFTAEMISQLINWSIEHLISNYSDMLLIISVTILWFQVVRYEDLIYVFVIHHNELNIWVFLSVGLIKQSLVSHLTNYNGHFSQFKILINWKCNPILKIIVSCSLLLFFITVPLSIKTNETEIVMWCDIHHTDQQGHVKEETKLFN